MGLVDIEYRRGVEFPGAWPMRGHVCAREGCAHTRCRHGVAFDDCRECLPNGQTVAEFLDEHEDPSLEDIAKVFGCHRDWIRQIQVKAEAKVLKRCRRLGLDVDDLLDRGKQNAA